MQGLLTKNGIKSVALMNKTIEKSRAKFRLPPEFLKVIKILETEISLEKIRDVFLALYPAKRDLVDRVRLCDICGMTFWANRDDSQTCSLRCANVFRVRRSREKKKEN